MDTVYSLEVWVPDGERWRWSAIGAYPTLDMAVAVGEGFLSVKPYRVRRVTDVGDGFYDFLAEEVFANAFIPGADGMWYNTAGQGFNPNVVPSYVADTYTAYNPALQRPVSLSESPV